MGVAVSLLVFLLKEEGQIYAHEARSRGERRALAIGCRLALKLRVLSTGPDPRVDANDRLEKSCMPPHVVPDVTA